MLTYHRPRPIVTAMRAIFLADAHLRHPSDPNYRALLAFLMDQRGRTDLLVLLGDIFEFWVGKASVTVEHAPLIDALEQLVQQGTKLVYVEGNHDFHLGPVFSRHLNCQVLPDGGCIELDSKKVYLAHGDLANPEDLTYRLLRKLLRSNPIRGLIRILPRSLLMAIADRSSAHSRKLAVKRQRRWPSQEILQPYAEALLSSGYQVVVTGHFHLPYHEKLGDGEHIALGDWLTQYSYAVYEDHTFRLTRYPAATLPAGASST
jgi:UDP-2,3-diacylglucosamine hydrolase